MNQEREQLYDDSENADVMNRYKKMIRNGKNYFFDVHEFEMLIEQFLQFGDFENAGNAIDIGIHQHPNAGVLLLKKAQLLIDKGENINALKILEIAEKLEIGNFELFLLKGIACNFIGLKKEAKNHFAKALEISGDNIVDTLFSIAVNFENLNEHDTALHYLNAALEKDKKNLTILCELGCCHDRLEDYPNSIKRYNEYLDIDPFSDTAWFNLGVVYSKLLEFDKAIEAFDFTISINEKYVLAYLNKGNVLVNQNKYDLAVDAYKEYLSFDENNAETLCFVGECYERMGKLGHALEYYYRSLETDPNYSEAIYGIGIIHSIRENYQESILFIRKAIDRNPDSSDYWFSLGNIYSLLNQFEKAVEAYTRSIELDQRDYESWLNLSELYFKKNLLSKAIKTLEDAYQSNSDVALINYRLAAYNLLKHNISESLEYIKQGMKNNFEEHEELFKFYPAAVEIKEITELIQQFNSIKQ